MLSKLVNLLFFLCAMSLVFLVTVNDTCSIYFPTPEGKSVCTSNYLQLKMQNLKTLSESFDQLITNVSSGVTQ